MSVDAILSAPLALSRQRGNNTNPNHHLWCNNGTWWMHFTHYPTPATKERVRVSLKTGSIEEARRMRDSILAGKQVVQ